MKKTILEKVADNKFNAVKQLVRFIRENDKDPGGFEDLWENSFALEDELDEIILRIAHIIELEKSIRRIRRVRIGPAETRALSFLYFAETAAAIMEVIPL